MITTSYGPSPHSVLTFGQASQAEPDLEKRNVTLCRSRAMGVENARGRPQDTSPSGLKSKER